ncbi:MAG: DNA methyltransferase [Kiritimatiellia bacterium]
MPITWDEVRHKAIRFSRDWAWAVSEVGEKQTFWNEFFEVFGLKRRSVATFEEPVQSIRGTYGRIDLFWRGIVLVEHKSLGEDLGAAASQAFAYIGNLNAAGRGDEVPRYVIVSDFARFVLYDLEPDEQRELPLFSGIRYSRVDFGLGELHMHVRSFAFLRGERTMRLDPEDPANQKAYDRMCRLHDELSKGGFAGPELERLLVRVLFCLFADDNGIFEPNDFQAFIVECTRSDGSDLGARLNQLFDILNTPPEKRSPSLGEELSAFPYVNGALFAERLGFPVFTGEMRKALIECTHFQWARISPAVFGSLFQGILLRHERRQKGGHYTGERDIMKVIRSLFLENLRAEFESIRKDASTRRTARLEDFHEKLRRMRFLDPACGCGNFLVIAYREIRQLELELLEVLHGKTQVFDIRTLVKVDVDQFFGIEIGEWPCRIAEVALWLLDHQMNVKVGEAFGKYFQRLPLKNTPHIVCGNALRLDWKTILPAGEDVLVMGNPPFVGKKEQDAGQKADMETVWGSLRGTGNLDYVTCWYRKAADYIQGTHIRCAFVSTNSITQGEQVGILWSDLFGSRHVKIHFAHRTFPWESEARGKAHVHVVIIGFAAFDTAPKYIFEYQDPKAPPAVAVASNINPYLMAGSDTTVRTRTKPVNDAPEISYGSMMIDKDRAAGDECGLILTSEARAALLNECPALSPFVREIYGGEEFLNGSVRWCLWLAEAPPDLLRQSPLLLARIETVRAFRLASGRPQTKELARTPTLFGEIRQPSERYLLIPKVSSETRQYLPMGFLSPQIIASGSALIIPRATKYDFGILSSGMHNAWIRTVAGRLESRIQYSNNIVYNNYPWPELVDAKQKSRVEVAAQAVLDARDQHPTSTLADLYDPHSMPPNLSKAHSELDRAVDRCYRKQPFTSDRERVEFLFALYEKLTMPLAPTEPVKRTRRSRK